MDPVETIRLVKTLLPRTKEVLGFFSWEMTIYKAAKVVYAMMTEYTTKLDMNIFFALQYISSLAGHKKKNRKKKSKHQGDRSYP